MERARLNLTIGLSPNVKDTDMIASAARVARDLFRFSTLRSVDLAICSVAGVFSVMWFEALKIFGRGRIVRSA
jgi:hypothetical protein